MNRTLVIFGLLLLLPLFSVRAHADAVAIGLLSYDQFIAGTPGVNAFNISNFTGSFALPPGFPVITSLSFTNVTLTLLESNGTTLTMMIGSIGPGPFLDNGSPPAFLQFPQTTSFSSANLTGFLGLTTVALSDGSKINLESSFTVSLSAPAGSSLNVGDSAVILANTGIVPEPGTLILMGTGFAGLWALRRHRF